MVQLFGRRVNTIARAVFLFSGCLVGAGAWCWAAFVRSDYVMRVGYPLEQPVPFSHEHHVSGLGIDCRYCHASVERSAFAGMPSTHTCMTCHSQLWTDAEMLEPVRSSLSTRTPLQWNRVHDLPDFVYFDHSIHVKKGIGCTTCHGRIGRMPLTQLNQNLWMRWCLDCHTEPEKFVRPRDQVFNPDYEPPSNQAELGARLIGEYRVAGRTDCSACHR